MASRRRSRKAEHRALLYRHRKYYDQLLAHQGGGCGICGRPPGSRRLALDHSHRKMRVLGLLCTRCNMMLRTWVTPEWLRKAADYLENPPFDQLPVESGEGDTT